MFEILLLISNLDIYWSLPKLNNRRNNNVLLGEFFTLIFICLSLLMTETYLKLLFDLYLLQKSLSSFLIPVYVVKLELFLSLFTDLFSSSNH